MLYSSLSYRDCINIGDTFQSIAIEQVLPRVDQYVDRDYLHDYSGPKTFLILNGFFLERSEGWPPSPSMHPLFFGFHAHNPCIFSHIEYLQKYAPIGCRDLTTLRALHKLGIDAYFSGCLTLSLQNPFPSKERSGIYIVDLDEHELRFVPDEIRERARFLTHLFPKGQSFTWRDRHAKELLGLYASAELVITRRLHCALPCAAFGTPCYCFKTQRNASRLEGMERFLHIVSAENPQEIDWSCAPVKREEVLSFTQWQDKKCREAILLWEDSHASVFSGVHTY